MSSTQQEISDMPLLTQDEAQTLLKKVLGYSKADECEVKISGSEGGNLRYARNSISTSGALQQTSLQVAAVFGKRKGIATINEYDDVSLRKVVLRAEEMARLAPENPEYMPFTGPQQYGPAAHTFIPATAAPIIMLNNLEALGKPERTVSGEGGGTAMIPPMKIRDFTFTSLSDAV
jgi:hypothetical protein